MHFLKKIRVNCCYPFPSVRPSERKVCHCNSVYILRNLEKILQDLIGCDLQMRNKVLKFPFCPLGSNRGRKMTFSRVVLSLKLHIFNIIDILRRRPIIFQEIIGYVLWMRNKVSEFSFHPEGSNEGRKVTFHLFCKVFLLELHLHL